MSDKCKIIKPDNKIDKLLYNTFTDEIRKGYVEIGDEKICMPLSYKDIADRIENFDVRDTDIFVITHPKAGTTWTQEMVWLIVNNLDFHRAQEDIILRFPFLEFEGIFDFSSIYEKFPLAQHQIHPGIRNSINLCKNYHGTPRLIKSHLPWSVLPKALREGKTKAKIIYVARNPKDVCVSYYNHGILLEGFKGSFDQFCDLFLAGRLHSGPYWKNTLSFWNRRNQPNILINTYEEMTRDLRSVIKKTSDFFIGKQFSEDEIEKFVIHLSFENMKNNQYVNYDKVNMLRAQFLNQHSDRKFMRCGRVGSYKNEMSPEIEKKFDEWIEENTKGIDMNF